MRKIMIIVLCFYSLIANAQEMYTIFDEQFNADGLLARGPDFEENIANGFCYVEYKKDQGCYGTFKWIKFNTKENFTIETAIKKISGTQSYYGYGLLFYSEQGKEYQFLINTAGYFKVDNYIDGSIKPIKDWTSEDAINKNNEALNYLSILKIGNKLNHYINDKLVYSCDSKLLKGNDVRFILFKKQKIAIDYLKVTTASLAHFYYTKANNLEKTDWGSAFSFINKAISLDSTYSDYYELRADYLVINRDLNGAIKDYSRAISLNPLSRYYDKRALVFRKLGDIDNAIKDYTNAIKLNPWGIYYNKRANLYFSLGNYVNAILDYTEAINYQNFYTYYYRRGYCNLKVGNNEQAQKDFANAISKAHNFNSKAWIKCLANDIGGALNDVNIALNKDRKAAIIDTRATAYGLANEYQKALNDFNEAVMLEPETALYVYKRGLIKKAMKDISGAEQDFARAKELDPYDDYLYIIDPLIDYLAENEINNYKNKLPPILAISDITFSENILDAEETANLSITVQNSGPGTANNVYVDLSSNLKGLSFPTKTTFPAITANGGSKTINIDIKGDINLPTSVAVLNIEVVEPNFKVRIQGKKLIFNTREFRKPELVLAKYAVIENQSATPNNQIDVNEMIDLKFAIQNIGQGNAENVKINVENHQSGVMFLGVVDNKQLLRQNPNFNEIQSGRYETITYRYFVNSEFIDEQLEFTIESNERIGEYGFKLNKSFPINKQLEESGYIRSVAKTDGNDIQGEIIIEDIPDFVVDVDTNIPISNTQQTNTYALIIGNEDYKSKQKGLSYEQNVDFAENDAQVFSLYCKKTLGIPPKQIKLLKNATSAEINQGLAWISNLSKIEKGNAKLIFYYSGHGLPHEQTKESYIIPVDVAASNIEYAVKLSDIYMKLTEYPAKQITVFLDACFSGGARSQELISMKGVKIQPKENIITGNIVVYSSSSGNESSAVYREKQHGYFTYYLLKKLKETEGEVNYEKLSNYLIQSVSKETGLIGKIQTPQVKISPEVENTWKLWNLR